ncbi:MAG: hsp90 co-chaperone Cdc37 [Paramarteilia canceri]
MKGINMVKNMLDNVSTLATKRIEKLKEEAMKEVDSMLMVEGQLDPSQVMNILPDELTECFLKRDVEMLKNVLTSMEPEDADKYFVLCNYLNFLGT